jgi:hypothetical protein
MLKEWPCHQLFVETMVSIVVHNNCRDVSIKLKSGRREEFDLVLLCGGY